MHAFDPDLLSVAVLTTGLGALMAWLGAQKNLLELRPPTRRCPACRSVHTRAGRCYRSG